MKSIKSLIFIYLLFIKVIALNAIDINVNRFDKFEQLNNQTIRSIIKDEKGLVWFSTDSNIWKFDGYNLISIKEINQQIHNKSIYTLKHSPKTGLWISTKDAGLINLHQNKTKIWNTETNNNLKSNLISALEIGNDNLWIGTDKGLHLLNNQNSIIYYPFSSQHDGKSSYITSILNYSDSKLLIGTRTSLFMFNKKTNKFKNLSISQDEELLVFSLYRDYENKIWVSTNKGVFTNQNSDLDFVKYKPEQLSLSITSVAIDKSDIWVGTFSQGVLKISKKSGEIHHLKYDVLDKMTLSSDYIVSLLLDDSGLLWITTFTGGVNQINTQSIKFGLRNASINKLECFNSKSINDIYVSPDEFSLYATNSGLVLYNKLLEKCTSFLDEANINDIKELTKTKFSLSTRNGVYTFNSSNNELLKTVDNFNNLGFYFSENINDNLMLIGTWQGLYIFNHDTKETNIIKTNITKLNSAVFHSFIKDSNGIFYFATNMGLYQLNQDNELVQNIDSFDQFSNKDILSLHLDSGNIYIGVHQDGIYKYNIEGQKVTKFKANENLLNISIHSIQSDSNNNIWAGTSNGLIKVNFNSNQNNLFLISDGLQGNYFNINSSFKDSHGKLYFGGRNGFNAFNPEEIKININPPNIALTKLTRFGKVIQAGVKQDDFLLDKPINDLTELTLSHKDYVTGFEFAALDFTDPSRNKYAFKLEGFDPDWSFVDADNRRATYTNLPSGIYTLRVKGSNKDGIWNEQGKSLKIKVLPAPWKTWWAYTLYVLTLLALIYWYIQRKNRENIRITKMLKTQVKERTAELEIQKQTVENLLVRKNEMFANVSHEFRTPLTLILGPVNKLLNSRLHSDDIQSLRMVNRNANRLLTMIEQLLLLAKITGEEQVQHIPQLVNHQILSIIEIFQPLAKERGVKLTLVNNNKAAINAVPNTIDTVLGNLISNAIKYTPLGGKVSVNSYTKDQHVIIEVKDTGCGLDEQQKKEIFSRFTRLDSHANIDGVGIGLSVVEEMLKINKASIDIESEPGVGSLFRVKFATIDDTQIEYIDNDKHLLVNQLAKNARLQIDNKQSLVESTGQKTNETILIIEDNDDMRQHISDSIKSNFHCLLADRGKQGIALAVKHVPDIIICDVMMPEMDGFKVSRILRSDTRTSHIPLILLTALHDKESRIKGWREHIDAYLTKPFDAQELLMQLENILVIRNILKNKASKKIQAGKKSSKGTGLPKKDKEFVDKLNGLISKNYQNPVYQRIQLASDMAVSEKQLQRKLKALIDKNPMELLREYRLQKAAEKLKEGLQVSITCDECGFNSVSHFSQCFKAHYGVSPKVYQQTCKG